jgi:hypothetical protein
MGNTIMSCSVYWIHHPSHTDIFTQGYIGISNNVKNRFESHKKDLDGSPLHQAIQHKGADKFKFEMIDEVQYIDIEQLHILESVYMDKFNSISCGFNTKHATDMFNLF